MYTIENYRPELLESWLRCRALAYMRSGFQDEITGEKETVTAENGISLVATVDSQVVGIAEAIFLNQEQAKPESYGLPAKMPLSTLDTMAVHPDFQHQGIAKALLAQLKRRLQSRGGALLIYTLDDEPANQLYRAVGAKLCYTAAIVHGHSSHNKVPQWVNFHVTDDHQMTLYDAQGAEIPYGQDMETYFVGKKLNIDLLKDVSKIVTEYFYVLDI